MKVAIFGGTFSPPHIEHINIVAAVSKQFDFDKIIVLPCGVPPHKQDSDVICSSHRFDMTNIAFGCYENVEVSSYELHSTAPSYSYLTLEYFSKLYDDLYFIIGSDSLKQIDTWRNPDRLFELAKIVVVGRGETVPPSDRYIVCDYVAPQVSSTDIRIELEFGYKPSTITDSVYKYICDNNLYHTYSKYVNEIRCRISHSRYIHTMNTVKMCFEINFRFNLKLDEGELFKAACLHDIAKSITLDEIKELTADSRIINAAEGVRHAFYGRQLAQQLFPELSEEVLLAIEYHTTFRRNISAIEKVVAISDSIERGRDYIGAEQLRQAVFSDLDGGVYLYLSNLISELNKKGINIENETLEAYKYFKEITNGR